MRDNNTETRTSMAPSDVPTKEKASKNYKSLAIGLVILVASTIARLVHAVVTESPLTGLELLFVGAAVAGQIVGTFCICRRGGTPFSVVLVPALALAFFLLPPGYGLLAALALAFRALVLLRAAGLRFGTFRSTKGAA